MQDEGFHEIQLNGKQLVFLFMAGTVVAVVIFLCGVMVGRGVPERTLASTTGLDEPVDPTASVPPPAGTPVGTSDTKPVAASEHLSYQSLLEDPNPPEETIAPAAKTVVSRTPSPASKPVLTPRSTAAATAAPQTPAPAKPVLAAVTASLSEPSGTGFVVQVAAVRARNEAERIAQRLNSKGYPAFVTTAGANFRVRVGKYDDRRVADTIAARLQREEQFKPWVTR